MYVSQTARDKLLGAIVATAGLWIIGVTVIAFSMVKKVLIIFGYESCCPFVCLGFVFIAFPLPLLASYAFLC